MIRKIVIAACTAGMFAALAGCNTVRGVGSDIESVANSVDRAT